MLLKKLLLQKMFSKLKVKSLKSIIIISHCPLISGWSSVHSETIDTGVVWVAMVTGDVKSHITENFLVVFLYKTQYPILNFSH